MQAAPQGQHEKTLHQSNSSLYVFFHFLIQQVDFWRCFDILLDFVKIVFEQLGFL
jgi:hypothetical protein